MRENFYNPEIRKSTYALFAIMLLILAINTAVVQMNFSSLKRDYVGVLGAVTWRVVEKSPELETVIVPLMTKPIAAEEALRGKEILKEYGLSDELENKFFPYMNKTILYTNITQFTEILLLAMLLFYLNCLQFGYFYHHIRNFTKAAQKIVDGEYDLKLSDIKDGDLSKLVSAFNSMGDVIRSNISELTKGKEFLANLLSDISHQLKTPLSSMILYNEIMLTKELPRNQQETFLISNQKQLDRMKNLILNLLKLARLDADAISLEKCELNLYDTVEEVAEVLESKADEAGVKMIIKGNENVLLNHDRLWLQEAVINIVKNAIEHTPDGGSVTIETLENPIYKRLEIYDTGVGISPDELPYIFKRFYKTKRTNKSDSAGIGLSIAKSIIERHGGVLEVESREGAGTKFIATFLKY